MLQKHARNNSRDWEATSLHERKRYLLVFFLINVNRNETQSEISRWQLSFSGAHFCIENRSEWLDVSQRMGKEETLSLACHEGTQLQEHGRTRESLAQRSEIETRNPIHIALVNEIVMVAFAFLCSFCFDLVGVFSFVCLLPLCLLLRWCWCFLMVSLCLFLFVDEIWSLELRWGLGAWYTSSLLLVSLPSIFFNHERCMLVQQHPKGFYVPGFLRRGTEEGMLKRRPFFTGTLLSQRDIIALSIAIQKSNWHQWEKQQRVGKRDEGLSFLPPCPSPTPRTSDWRSTILFLFHRRPLSLNTKAKQQSKTNRYPTREYVHTHTHPTEATMGKNAQTHISSFTPLIARAMRASLFVARARGSVGDTTNLTKSTYFSLMCSTLFALPCPRFFVFHIGFPFPRLLRISSPHREGKERQTLLTCPSAGPHFSFNSPACDGTLDKLQVFDGKETRDWKGHIGEGVVKNGWEVLVGWENSVQLITLFPSLTSSLHMFLIFIQDHFGRADFLFSCQTIREGRLRYFIHLHMGRKETEEMDRHVKKKKLKLRDGPSCECFPPTFLTLFPTFPPLACTFFSL
jgi:hypothetical protein